MNTWIAVVVIGAVLLLIGMGIVIYEYRRGLLSRGALALHALAFIMVVAAAGMMISHGTSAGPSPGFAIFFPLWLALVVAARRRRRKNSDSGQRQQVG